MPKTLQNGAFKDADGTAIATGTLVLTLSQDAQIITGGNLDARDPIKGALDINGNVAGTLSVYGQDELSPGSTYYTAEVLNSGGSLVWGPTKWVISGASPINLNLMVPTLLNPDPAYSQPVLQNPAATQTITGQSLTMTNTAPLIVQGGGSLAGAFSGNPSFTGSPVFKFINAIAYADQFAGATADVQINAAISALPASGGTVDCRGYGATVQTLAAPLVVGGASKQITLLIDRSTQFNITVTGGVDAVQVWIESSIVALDSGNVLAVANFNLQSTANIANLMASYPRAGPSIMNLKGFTIRGNASATVTGAMLDLVGVTDKSTIQDLVIFNFAGPGLRISNAAGGVPVGPINITNVSVNGVGVAGAKPVQINDVTGGGIIADVNFFGGSLTHPGTGGLAIVDIEGSAANSINGVNFYGTQFESSNVGDIGIKIVNGLGITGSGLVFTSNVNAGTACIKISQSGALSHTLIFDNITNFNSWTNTIQDTINSVNITDARIARYTFIPPSANAATIYGATGQILTTAQSVVTVGGALEIGGATPTGSGTQLGLGTTTGFGNGAAGTAVTTTLKSTGSGPTTPQTVVKYVEIDLGGTKYWVPLVQ